MPDFDRQLQSELSEIRARDLYRELRRIDSAQGPRIRIGERELLNFSSNDYLGLANHALVKEAAIKAVEKFGVGSGASRLICGSLAPHYDLEEALAAFKGTEAALTFSSGYATALGTICALVGKGDIIAIDKLVHASIVDAARLSGAKLRVFAHNDLDDLERILKWADQRAAGILPAKSTKLAEPRRQDAGGTLRTAARRKRVLIVTESVFSMDGDLAPLRDIVELKDKYGAWLMSDEAHATGLFGEKRRGLAEACELADRVEVQMGTLGKAVAAAGGYICGSRALIDLLVNRARSFIFSTAPMAAQAAAAKAGIELIQSAEGEKRRAYLWSLVDRLKNALVGGPWRVPVVQSAIVPLIVGGEADAVELATKLRDSGVFVPAIRYPTVARGEARLRVTLTAAHSEEDVRVLAAALS